MLKRERLRLPEGLLCIKAEANAPTVAQQRNSAGGLRRRSVSVIECVDFTGWKVERDRCPACQIWIARKSRKKEFYAKFCGEYAQWRYSPEGFVTKGFS
jgi:hypothetical protein